MAALAGKTLRDVDELSACVRVTVPDDRLEIAACVLRQRIAHLNGRRELRVSLGEDALEVFAGVLSPGEKERDPHPRGQAHNTRGEDTRTLLAISRESHRGERLLSPFLHQSEDPRLGVVVVKDIALSRLTDELPVGGSDHRTRSVDDVSLRRGRKGNTEIPLQPLESVEGKPTSVF